MITDKVRIIRERMKEAQDRQKSYEDNRRRSLEFQVGGQSIFKNDTLEGHYSLQNKRKASSRIHEPLSDHEKNWAGHLLIGITFTFG